MKISKSELYKLYGIQLPSGKYRISAKENTYSINTVKDDTEGCPITGKERDEKHGEVSGSRLARDALYAKLEQAEALGEQIIWHVEGLPEKT